jgi:Flp pilus assembly protein TadD
MPKKSFPVIFVYFALALSTLVIYWQAHSFDFINYDDIYYVSQNDHILSGLTIENITWAFTTNLTANWHPLTWLSLMLDCQLFGPNPGWIHFINVLFHIANTLLLFAVLKKTTNLLWPSAFVAAAFALHPMHVESVAWIAERKDVLSTFFFMLTLLAYIEYVKKRSAFQYVLSIVIFAIGLMAKPMLVTLPFVLLLLDYWPLDRFARPQNKTVTRQKNKISANPRQHFQYNIIIEKIPFFALAAVSSVITFFVQRSEGAVVQIGSLPLFSRTANAFLSYGQYIFKMFWPQNLAVFYPPTANFPYWQNSPSSWQVYFPYWQSNFSLWQIIISVLILILVTFFVIRFRNRRYLPVGWFWFLGTLVPVIGLVQVGEQSMADRYTYIPYIGLFIMIAWGASDIFSKWRHGKIVLAVISPIVLTAMAISAYIQIGYWQNSITLFSHAIEVTKNNYLAHSRLGEALRKQGNIDLAIEHYKKSLEIMPTSANAQNNIGVSLAKKGNIAEAIIHFNEAIRLMPDFAEAHDNLANALALQGHLDDAVAQFREAIRLKSDWPEPMSNLAMLIASHPEIKNRDTDEAIRLASAACELTKYHDPVMVGTLAAAYASAGRFAEAVDTARKAISIADTQNKPQLKNVLEHHLSLYMHSQPYVEAPKSASSP